MNRVALLKGIKTRLLKVEPSDVPSIPVPPSNERTTNDEMSQEKISEKVSSDNLTQDVEAGDPTVVDESTHDPHMHRSLKGRHVSMIAIVSCRLYYY